jgi:hypothetical protein
MYVGLNIYQHMLIRTRRLVRGCLEDSSGHGFYDLQNHFMIPYYVRKHRFYDMLRKKCAFY